MGIQADHILDSVNVTSTKYVNLNGSEEVNITPTDLSKVTKRSSSK